MGLIVALFSVGIVCGVILALHFMGRRPINVNIDARAEAHGGTAYTSSDAGAGSGGGIISGITRLIKVAVLAACAIFAISLISNLAAQRNEPSKIIVNVPEQKPAPVVVNVPTQQAPTINVQPQAPVVNVPAASSPLETIILLAGGVASLLTIFVSFRIVKAIQAQEQSLAQHPYPVEYERTSYGWTPKKQAQPPAPDIAERTVKDDDVPVPDVFVDLINKL